MNSTRSERGVSLAEAVVALGVFGIALLGLNAMMMQTLKTAEFSKNLATARFLASHRLEQIKSSRYQDGDRDGYRNPSDNCTDIDEIHTGAFPDEDYGQVDLRNGTVFTFESCAANPDIKKAGKLHSRSDYAAGAQGEADYYLNHARYADFRREVYIVDSLDYTGTVTNVELGPPSPDSRDALNVTEISPTTANPKTNYIKYVLVRVKWKGKDGGVHHVTLSTEKAFYIPSY